MRKRPQPPADELRPSRRGGGVRVLDRHQPLPPPGRQDRRVEVHAVDAEPVLLLERRPLPSDTLDQVGQVGGHFIAVRDRQHVDLHRQGRLNRKFVLVVAPQDRLGTDDDDRRVADDLTCSADRVLQLFAPHRPATDSTFDRSGCGNKPPSGDTSRIWTESVSNPVITRRSPRTSRRSTNSLHRSRFDT